MRPFKNYIIHYSDENGYRYSEIITTVRATKIKLRMQGYKFGNYCLTNLDDASLKLYSPLSNIFCEVEELAEDSSSSVYRYGKEYLPLYKWGASKRLSRREIDTLVVKKKIKPIYIGHTPYIERDYEF